MTAAIKATREVAKNYWQLFVNRRPYTVQSMRPHPETGRHYSPGRQDYGRAVCHQPVDPAL